MLTTRFIKSGVGSFLLTGIFIIFSSSVIAYPTLQLDIQGGTYDANTQTIVASTNPFTLYALLNPDRSNLLSDHYYISAAVAPQYGPVGGDLGSFTFNGQRINVTSDMVYGIPPLESYILRDPGDLPSHGIFYTYFFELEFQFSASNATTPYNSMDNAGVGPSGTGSMYYSAFSIDTSFLNPDYVIHFDLYNTKIKSGGDIDITQFAPFSHDAESSAKVPEPGSLALLGFGLIGLGLFGRKR